MFTIIIYNRSLITKLLLLVVVVVALSMAKLFSKKSIVSSERDLHTKSEFFLI